MSKIGKKIIKIPSGVEIKISDGFVVVKGPKGELKRPVPQHMDVAINGSELKVVPQEVGRKQEKESLALWGLTAALISNMIKGVTEGFETGLDFQGVGYKAVVKGNSLELELGYSHSITVEAPEGISFKVEKNSIKVSGIDKELVGRVAAKIRSQREPEPYQGSGIKYADEVIKKKAGKKAASTTA